ncbi:MAG: hypothetical protein AUI13_02245 [Gemmatimonadetes bacterium 13_2_20CM_2_69_23]|nr:MAG: hypothetical protein AUI13_02245 [Gemmatimonadetes bacterium 13_2_20CM_2_69_23]
MRGVTRALLLAAALLPWWCRAVGQVPDSSALSPPLPPPPAPRGAPVWLRPAASLILPGAGQLLAHQDRGAVYLAVELYSVARIIQLTHEGERQANRFRDLAFEVARRGFAPAQRDTVFEYPGVPPDPMSPEYLRAVQFYQQHAVGPAFVWSWRSKPLEQGVFRETIRRSDDAFRTAQNVVGLLLANHVVSAVDALISSRLSAAAGRRTAVHTMLGPVTAVRLSVAF